MAKTIGLLTSNNKPAWRRHLANENRIARDGTRRVNDQPKTTISFDARQYVRSHFTQPRGRGCWAFSIGGDEIYWAPGNSTLSEAKTWLRDTVRSMPNMPRYVVALILP